MTILALEFSAAQRSVALARNGTLLAVAGETGGRGANAFGMIEQVLAAAAAGREEVEVLAVGLGPGSYTGIRVALSVAQGWQLARGVKLLGIHSVECLAVQAQTEKILGRVNVAIDAQRGEFYLATFEVSADAVKTVEPLRIVAATQIETLAASGAILIGPDLDHRFPAGKSVFPQAAALAQLAARRTDFCPGEMMKPAYLRETNFLRVSDQKKH